MTAYEIKGKNKLCGEIKVQGAKNSVLPILAATLLIHNKCIIHNCPDLSDVDAALKILIMLGCVCVRDDETVIVDATDAANFEIPTSLMHEMRSSVVFLGAMISRMGKAIITAPGGCEIGARPIDMHIEALRKLGVSIDESDGYLYCNAKNGIVGSEINLRFPSVGATENVILAAAISNGTTVINNAAREPEISDLADFLNSAGAQIYGAGSSKIIIKGVRKLHSAEHKIIPDRIVAATYLSAAAITKGDITLKNVMPSHFIAVLNLFKQMGCYIDGKENSLRIKSCNTLCPIKEIKTDVYPLFPTDAGSLIVPVLCMASGASVLRETIFENRFRFIPELNLFGADITVENNKAFINGNAQFVGAKVSCTDLRGGAALVIAALAAEGNSTVTDVFHIKRGYYDFCGCLGKLGADIKEV